MLETESGNFTYVPKDDVVSCSVKETINAENYLKMEIKNV